MGLFRKKPVLALTPAQVERQRVLEYIATLQPGTPEYRDAGQLYKFWNEVVEAEDEKLHPKKDKMSKADIAKYILALVGLASTWHIEGVKPFEAGRSTMRRFYQSIAPRFWGKDMDCEQKPPQPKR